MVQARENKMMIVSAHRNLDFFCLPIPLRVKNPVQIEKEPATIKYMTIISWAGQSFMYIAPEVKRVVLKCMSDTYNKPLS